MKVYTTLNAPDCLSDNSWLINASWFECLSLEFEKAYMQALNKFLGDELSYGKTIYPASDSVFSALNQVPLEKVKVVILGQDPYHGPSQAHGLSFSVPDGQAIPPSLKNVYKELLRDLNIDKSASGNLLSWAEQGVLLLNSVLTVEAGKAASHQGKGWEIFTDAVIKVINDQKESVVFILWGSYAQKKGVVIDAQKHLVLKSVHPSPLSAYRGFLGCGHFSQTNDYLCKKGRGPIQW